MIYFFAADTTKFKVGRSTDMLSRLRSYNVGRVEDIVLKYVAIVSDSILIERCIKKKLKPFEVIEGREIFELNPSDIKEAINDCYSSLTSNTAHKQLLEDLATLTGYYAYIKDKKMIKPYVVIET